jgi:hypothetical protein
MLNGPGACGRLLWMTAAAMCFMKQTLESPAHHHIARLAALRSITIIFALNAHLLFRCLRIWLLPGISNVVFPLSRAAVQMQVLEGSALCSIDDYSTLAHFAVTLQMSSCTVRQDLYFGPLGLSYQRRELRAYPQGSRRPTSTHHTLLVGRCYS